MSINLVPILEQLADEVIEVAQKNLGAYRSVTACVINAKHP